MPVPGTPRAISTYNFGAVVAILAGIPLSNYGADGELEFEFPSDLVESILSADGHVSYEVHMDQRVRVTVRVMETSALLPQLQAVWKAQMVAMWNGVSPPLWMFSMNCPSTGDFVNGRFVFLKDPTMGKAKGISTREFQFEMPYARFTGVFGLTKFDSAEFQRELMDSYSEVYGNLLP